MANKVKILFIEDDKFLRSLLVRKLEEAGFAVLVAVDGGEAFKKIKEEKPDLILLDIVLPDIDGFEVMKQFKEDPATSSIPVIFLTNLGQGDEVKKGLALDAVDYIVKAHFTPDEIIEKIEKLLAIHI